MKPSSRSQCLSFNNFPLLTMSMNHVTLVLYNVQFLHCSYLWYTRPSTCLQVWRFKYDNGIPTMANQTHRISVSYSLNYLKECTKKYVPGATSSCETLSWQNFVYLLNSVLIFIDLHASMEVFFV